MPSDRLAYALGTLSDDSWRKGRPFSTETNLAHEILINNPYASDDDRAEVLNFWIQRFQPCLFGRVAAARGRIHYCFITDGDLRRGEEWVEAKIARERRHWKMRGIDPATSGLEPAHSFVLHVASPRVAYASPDNSLRALALLIRELWGCEAQRDAHGNDVAVETLYLKSPESEFVRFLVNLDFFAAQGEGRWWHDHRIPGGFAFTANATGHMACFQSWYERKTDSTRWTLNTAMRTIDGAQKTAWGVATALLPLKDGRPLVASPCPFALHPSLKDKDWTKYRGYYDTDHSVRDEFFRTDPARQVRGDLSEWLQDFTYIYDGSSEAHKSLMAGTRVDPAEIEGELGSPETWRRRPGTLRPEWLDRLAKGTGSAVRGLRSSKLRLSLAESRAWALSPSELAEIEGAA